MELTPIDLRKQEFKRAVRGYDPLEVRRFLEEVGEAWEELIRSQEEARRRASELGEALENYRRIERTLNETLLAAQRLAEDSRETTLREAEIIRKEAEMEGRHVIERAEAEAQRVQEQTRELRVQRDQLFHKLRNVIEEELLRVHALRETYAEPPHPAAAAGPSATAESKRSRPEPPAKRRSALAPPAAARELVQRPRGLRERAPAVVEDAAWNPATGVETV